MVIKFHAGYLNNGDSSERKWKAKELKMWVGVNY